MINKFLQSICNCSDYCLSLDDINCSPDDTIITIVVTLKEKQSLFLGSLVYSTLQEGYVKVDQNYSIFCVVKTLCEKLLASTTASPQIPSNISITTDSQVTDENNGISLVVAVVISAGIVIALLILVLLITVAIILRSRTRRQNAKLKSQTVSHMTDPAQSPDRTTTGNGHPSTSSNESGIGSLSDGNDSGAPVSDSIADDPFPPVTINKSSTNHNIRTNPSTVPHMTNPVLLASRIIASSEHPSTSSHESGVYSLSDSNDSGPPIDDSTADDPFPPVTIDKSSTNHNIRTNHSFPAVRSTINSSNKHKVIKQNKIPKHQDVQLVNQPQNIRWKKNETYAQVNLYSALNPSKPPAIVPDCNPPLHHLYDDIEGINESRRRAAGNQMPHKTKHRTCTSLHITQNSSYASSVNGVTRSGNGSKVLLTTNYKHPSSSQV